MFRHSHNPPNRFDQLSVDWEEPPPPQKLRLVPDHSLTVLSKNSSPDIGFDWSVNPYRGCTHGCAYCYARPYHEYLGYSAGTDFERIIVYKPNAAELLRSAFDRKTWRGDHIAFSGVTDCYQQVERKLKLTRSCIEVCLQYRNPTSIITRSPLVLRDLDLLVELARIDAVRVHISLPLIDNDLAKRLEPGAPPPSARLETIRRLSRAEIPVGISLAPIIPGLSDERIPKTLHLAREAGALWAWGGLLRLPGAVTEVFERRLRDAYPNQAERVMRRLKEARNGQLNSSRFGQRMRGHDKRWKITEQLLNRSKARLGYKPLPPFGPTPFKRPNENKQLGLFEPNLP